MSGAGVYQSKEKETAAMLFSFKKKKQPAVTWDPALQKPVLHRSICSGETAAGFKDLSSGTIHEVMLIRNDRDLQEFMDTYGLTETPETVY